MRYFITLLLTLVSVSSFSLAEKKIPLTLLMAKLKEVNTMTANFQQTVLDGSRVIQKNNGKLYLQRPYKFQWKEAPPSSQMIISNGQIIWIYDEALEQVTIKPIDLKSNDSPIFLLTANLNKLSKEFIITYEKTNRKEIFLLTPKVGNASAYQWVKLIYQDQKLSELLLEDNLSQITRLIFSKMILNNKLPTRLFTFIPPSGVDVVR